MPAEQPAKKNIWLLVSIIAILILIAVAYWQLSAPSPEEKEEEKIIDDSISPMENQALFVQVLRIRNRGLMDAMLSYGTEWRNPPSFYYTVTVDDESGSTKGYVGETGVYTTWDTMGYESTTTFDVDEERERSSVTISIIEEQPAGLLGRRTEEVEVEKISLTYDYRTGRWSGDDYFMDNDGMGHFLGETYEVWFHLYQADYDHDGIPYWIERNVLGTDPAVDDSRLDPDNDGIPTDWEWWYGYDPFTYNDHATLDPDIDGIENREEYQIRAYFSNPFQPNIYIETDGMEKKGAIDIDHIFYKESQQMIIERFAQHGIWVFIDDGWKDGPPNGGGELLPHVEELDDVLGKQMLAFYTHHFADERKGIFRYIVIADKDGGFITPVSYNTFDAMCIGNSFNSMLTRLAFTPREIRVQLAKAVLHEMGHSIGLMPWTFPGNDIMNRRSGDRYPSMSDEEYNGYVENYYSIMNYQYIYNKPFFFSDETHTYLFDYSDGSNGPPYDQNDWAHVYLPTFQIDVISYETPSLETFEDFEFVNDYPGVVVEGWVFDENLTEQYRETLSHHARISNAEVDIQVFMKPGAEKDEYNLRVYAQPRVEPVFSVHSLVAEGRVDTDTDGTITFYSQQALIDAAIHMIS